MFYVVFQKNVVAVILVTIAVKLINVSQNDGCVTAIEIARMVTTNNHAVRYSLLFFTVKIKYPRIQTFDVRQSRYSTCSSKSGARIIHICSDVVSPFFKNWREKVIHILPIDVKLVERFLTLENIVFS